MYRFAPKMNGEASTFELLLSPDIGDMPSVPALSATSDTPEPATPPPTEPPPSEPPAGDGGDQDSGGESAEAVADAGGEGNQPAAPPARNNGRFGERLSEMARDRDAARQRADRLEGTLSQMSEALARLVPATPASPAAGTETTPPPTAAPRPTRESFDDPDAYDAALIEWSTRTATAAAAAEVERQLAAQRAADERTRSESENQQRFEQTQARFAEKQTALTATPEFSDYQDVALNPDLPITEHMTPAILEAENGPAVLYHLGKNPDEAARIAALPPMRQIIEIGRISARLEAPAAPPPRRLPPPIDPLNGNRNPAEKTETDDEYYARRSKELQNQRRASMWGRPAATA